VLQPTIAMVEAAAALAASSMPMMVICPQCAPARSQLFLSPWSSCVIGLLASERRNGLANTAISPAARKCELSAMKLWHASSRISGSAWAKVLKPGMVVAVRASAAEHGLEGSFWLALIMSEAFPVTEDMVHQSAEYEAGFLVVKAKYYSLEQRSPRGYVLKDEEWILDVNAMFRPNVIFSGGSVGKAPRESRSGLHILEEDWVNCLRSP